jgi:hypothetical protein
MDNMFVREENGESEKEGLLQTVANAQVRRVPRQFRPLSTPSSLMNRSWNPDLALRPRAYK